MSGVGSVSRSKDFGGGPFFVAILIRICKESQFVFCFEDFAAGEVDLGRGCISFGCGCAGTRESSVALGVGSVSRAEL